MSDAQYGLLVTAAQAAEELYKRCGATPVWRKLMDAMEHVWEEEDS